MTREELKQELDECRERGIDARPAIYEAVKNEIVLTGLDYSELLLSDLNFEPLFTIMTGPNFQNTSFSRTNLTRAKLHNPDFNGTYFNDTNVSGMNFSGARNLTQEQLGQCWAHEDNPPINLPKGLHFNNAIYGSNGKSGNLAEVESLADVERLSDIDITPEPDIEERPEYFTADVSKTDTGEPVGVFPLQFGENFHKNSPTETANIKTQDFRKEPITDQNNDPYHIMNTGAAGLEVGPDGASYLYPAKTSEGSSEGEVNKLKVKIKNCYFNTIAPEDAVIHINLVVNTINNTPLGNDANNIELINELKFELKTLSEALTKSLIENKELKAEIDILRQVSKTNTVFKECLKVVGYTTLGAVTDDLSGLILTSAGQFLSSLGAESFQGMDISF